MRRFLFLFLALFFLAFPLVARADGPSHVVAYGETLYSIAAAYGVSTQALAQANGITAQSWVYAGQLLTIPGGDDSSSATAVVSVAETTSGSSYLVRAGDTLSSVSFKFGVSINAIADANNIPPNGFLYTGWQLKIPGANSTALSAPPAPAVAAPAESNANSSTATGSVANSSATGTSSYIVQPGDTLFGIAIKNNVTMQAIVIANNLATTFVYSNQRLLIPTGGTMPSTAAANSVASKPVDSTVKASASVGAGIQVQVANVPILKQAETLTCEEAAAAMASGGKLTEDQIVAAMPKSDNPFDGIRGDPNYTLIGGLTHYGTYAQGLQKGLAKLGHQSTAYYGQPYDKFKASILENLKEGHPVVWWTTWHETYQETQQVQVSDGTTVPLTPYEHSVVITAANDEGVTYNDPYDGTVRFTSWANHQRASGYFNNMALVIY